jgi:hypothetical protein
MHIQQVLRPRHRTPANKYLALRRPLSGTQGTLPTALSQKFLQTSCTSHLAPRSTFLPPQPQLRRRYGWQGKTLGGARVCGAAAAYDGGDDGQEDDQQERERGVDEYDGAGLLGKVQAETAGDEDEGQC